MIEEPVAPPPPRRGRPTKRDEDKAIVFSVSMSPQLHAQVCRIARAQGVSLSSAMASAARLLLWHHSVSAKTKT